MPCIIVGSRIGMLGTYSVRRRVEDQLCWRSVIDCICEGWQPTVPQKIVEIVAVRNACVSRTLKPPRYI